MQGDKSSRERKGGREEKIKRAKKGSERWGRRIYRGGVGDGEKGCLRGGER